MCHFLNRGLFQFPTEQTFHCDAHSGKINAIIGETLHFPLSLLCFTTVCEYSHAVSVAHYRFLREAGITTPRTNRSDINTYQMSSLSTLLFNLMRSDILVGFELRLAEPFILIPRLAFSGPSGEFPNGFHLTKLASSR